MVPFGGQEEQIKIQKTMKAKDHDMAQFAFSEFRKKMDFGTVVASREGFCVRLVCVCVCVLVPFPRCPGVPLLCHYDCNVCAHNVCMHHRTWSMVLKESWILN